MRLEVNSDWNIGIEKLGGGFYFEGNMALVCQEFTDPNTRQPELSLNICMQEDGVTRM